MKQPIAAVLGVVSTLFVVCACGGHSPTQPTTSAGSSLENSLPGPAGARTASSSNHSEQVVFSGVAAIGSTFSNGSPVGFWIWCEAESNNPYGGECNGAMYFYALGITKHVSDIEDVTSIEEFGNEQYRIKVRSTKDTSIDCTLESAAPPQHGPNNTVVVTCTTPAGTATSNNTVVNVTGPGD